MRGVALGQAGRHEALDWLSEEILRRPTERLLDPRAGIDDPTATIDGNDGVRARVEHLLGVELERCRASGLRGVHVADASIGRVSSRRNLDDSLVAASVALAAGTMPVSRSASRVRSSGHP